MKYKLVNKVIDNNYLVEYLRTKGVENFEEYLNPPASTLSPPELLDNIKEGAALIEAFLKTDKVMFLLVDCDCDGFTSSAILYSYLRRIKPDVKIQIGIHEGKQHGLEDQMEVIGEVENLGLIVTPDAGSNDIDYHKQIDVPVLVLDHHILESEVLPHVIVVNNEASKEYPNKALTGAGVVFQFCRYLDKIFGTSYANDYMDLAALGIIGDMGSLLTLENRYIVKNGLENIKNSFFSTLCEKQSFSMGGKITPMTVAFYVVPLINAMVRFGKEEEKERMFLAFADGKQMVPCLKRGAKGTFEKVAVESARECGNARINQNKTKQSAVEALEARIFKEGLIDNQILLIVLGEEDDFPRELNGLTLLAR